MNHSRRCACSYSLCNCSLFLPTLHGPLSGMTTAFLGTSLCTIKYANASLALCVSLISSWCTGGNQHLYSSNSVPLPLVFVSQPGTWPGRGLWYLILTLTPALTIASCVQLNISVDLISPFTILFSAISSFCSSYLNSSWRSLYYLRFCSFRTISSYLLWQSPWGKSCAPNLFSYTSNSHIAHESCPSIYWYWLPYI